jgi:hypothetical protein
MLVDETFPAAGRRGELDRRVSADQPLGARPQAVRVLDERMAPKPSVGS